MSSDTEATPNHTEEVEERRTYHWKLRPSQAKRLAVYARTRGLMLGGAIEQAIDLLVRTHNDGPQGEKQ